MEEKNMKTKFIALCAFALSLVALSSCNKADVETVEPQGQEVKLKVFSEETKTYLASGITNWSNGDIIYVLDQKGKWYNSSKLASGTVVEAEFTFSAFPADPTYALFVGANNSETLGIEDGQVTANLISEQSISNNNSFGKNANLTIGEVVKVDETTYGASLKNVCGLLKFTVPEGIASVEISGNNDEDLAGEIYIDYNSGEPTWIANAGVKTVTVVPRQSNEVYQKGTYYACVLPQTFEEGITVTLTDVNGYTAQTKGSNPLALGRNKVIELPNLNVPEAPQQESTVLEFDFLDLKIYPADFPTGTENAITVSDVTLKDINSDSYTFKVSDTTIGIFKTTDIGFCLFTKNAKLTFPTIEGKQIVCVKFICGNQTKKIKYYDDGTTSDAIDIGHQNDGTSVEITGTNLTGITTTAANTVLDKLILTYK